MGNRWLAVTTQASMLQAPPPFLRMKGMSLSDTSGAYLGPLRFYVGEQGEGYTRLPFDLC